MRVRCWSAAIICASLFWAAPAAAQNVKAGIEAWQRGDYRGAVAIWRPLAEAGDADAAFNLGQAYRLGRGVPVDLAHGADLARAGGRTRPCRRPDDARPAAVPERPAGGGPALAEAGGRERRSARDAGLRHRSVQWRRRRRRTRCSATPMSAASAAQGLAPAKDTLAQMDEIIPLAQRKKGVALAMQKAKTQPRRNRSRAPKATAQKPAAKPRRAAKPPAVASASGGRMADPAWRLLPKGVGRSAVPQVVRKRTCRGPSVLSSRRWQRNALQVGPYREQGRGNGRVRHVIRPRPGLLPRRSATSSTPRPSRAADSLSPQQGVEPVMVEPRIGDFGERRLGAEGDAQPRFLDHQSVVGAVADRRAPLHARSRFPRGPRPRHRAWPVHRRSGPRPRRLACRPSNTRRLARTPSNPSSFAIGSANDSEPAR